MPTAIYPPKRLPPCPHRQKGATMIEDSDGCAEGERRRDAALDLLRQYRAGLVRSAQRALLAQLLDAGTATADDVRKAVELPDGIDPKVFGAAPTPLVEAGLIRSAGYQRSCRRVAHARPLTVWALVDRAGTLAWLATHPELTPPDGDNTAPQIPESDQ
jgi:hypothetical protein